MNGKISPTSWSTFSYEIYGEGDVPKCRICGEKIRPRVMLYEDENGENICEDWESQLKLDVPKSDLFLWIGISFKQAASLEYFREVRRILMSSSNTTLRSLPHHIIINPDKTATENLESACVVTRTRKTMHGIQTDNLFVSSSKLS